MADSWTIVWQGRSWTVRPFRHRDTALHHAQDHYLDHRESWEQVDAVAVRLRGEHRRATDELSRAGVVEAACARYEAAIPRLTAKGRIDEARVRPYDGYRSLMVATDMGLFAAFGEELSDLRTAFRPWRGVVRGDLRVQDYRDNARWKIAKF